MSKLRYSHLISLDFIAIFAPLVTNLDVFEMLRSTIMKGIKDKFATVLNIIDMESLWFYVNFVNDSLF